MNVPVEPAPWFDRPRAGSRMARKPTMMGTKDSPFTTKQTPSPNCATSTPASAGPRMRAALTSVELRATALVMSSRPTISIRKLWRAGISNA